MSSKNICPVCHVRDISSNEFWVKIETNCGDIDSNQITVCSKQCVYNLEGYLDEVVAKIFLQKSVNRVGLKAKL